MGKASFGWKVSGKTKTGKTTTYYSGTQKRAEKIGDDFFPKGKYSVSKLKKRKYI